MFRIKEILSEKGMTAKELADLMNVSPQYISGIIREKDSASVSVLSKIAEILDVPMASLFEDFKLINNYKCPHCGKPIRIKLDRGEDDG